MTFARRSLKWLLATAVVIGAIATVALISLVSSYLFREHPGARSVDDALAEFRTSGTIDRSIGAEASLPPEGVYTAAGDGTASISFPPASQDYGAVVPVTITHQGDMCWSSTVAFNTAFEQTWTYCIVDGALVERGDITTVRWDLGPISITNTTIFDCDPTARLVTPGETEGQSTDLVCTGHSDEVEGTSTSQVHFESVGVETLRLSEMSIPTYHFVETDTLTGAQRGTTRIDFWYSVGEFLLVRMERHVDLRTESPVGAIDYSEDGEWQLVSTDVLR